MGWEVDLQEPSISTRTVLHPTRLPRPPRSSAQAFAEALKKSELEVTCATAGSACVCAAMPECAWIPMGDNATMFDCVKAVYKQVEPGVPCVHCSIQWNCPEDPMGICSTLQEPCACASSHGDCFWNPE